MVKETATYTTIFTISNVPSCRLKRFVCISMDLCITHCYNIPHVHVALIKMHASKTLPCGRYMAVRSFVSLISNCMHVLFVYAGEPSVTVKGLINKLVSL